MPPSFDPSTNNTTELAKRRNHAAAERTLLTWIESCLTLLGLGITIDRIYATLSKVFPDVDRRLTEQGARVLGLSTLALGLGLLALAMWQYKISTRSLQREDYLLMSSRPLILTATAAVVLFGILATFFVWFGSL